MAQLRDILEIERKRAERGLYSTIYPFFRICNAEAVNIRICNAEKQRYAVAVVRQPYSPTVGL